MTSKIAKFGFLVTLISAIIMAGCDESCDSCVADPFATQNAQGEWVTKPTSNDNVIVRADKAVSKAVYNTPTSKTCIETIGAGNSAKVLDEFAARCGRFGGTVAQSGISTMGCYK